MPTPDDDKWTQIKKQMEDEDAVREGRTPPSQLAPPPSIIEGLKGYNNGIAPPAANAAKLPTHDENGTPYTGSRDAKPSPFNMIGMGALSGAPEDAPIMGHAAKSAENFSTGDWKGGVHQALTGAGQIGGLFTPAALQANPQMLVPMLRGLALGGPADFAGRQIAQHLGGDEGTQDLAGDALGLGAGALGFKTGKNAITDKMQKGILAELKAKQNGLKDEADMLPIQRSDLVTQGKQATADQNAAQLAAKKAEVDAAAKNFQAYDALKEKYAGNNIWNRYKGEHAQAADALAKSQSEYQALELAQKKAGLDLIHPDFQQKITDLDRNTALNQVNQNKTGRDVENYIASMRNPPGQQKKGFPIFKVGGGLVGGYEALKMLGIIK